MRLIFIELKNKKICKVIHSQKRAFILEHVIEFNILRSLYQLLELGNSLIAVALDYPFQLIIYDLISNVPKFVWDDGW
jgi:hypothetical protein